MLYNSDMLTHGNLLQRRCLVQQHWYAESAPLLINRKSTTVLSVLLRVLQPVSCGNS
jgi:hypothetical protein